jgi:hypothetical protein
VRRWRRPEHLRLAIDAACVALWSWHVDSNRFTMDERSFELWKFALKSNLLRGLDILSLAQPLVTPRSGGFF